MWVTKNEQTGRWINFNVFFSPRDCNVQPDNLMVLYGLFGKIHVLQLHSATVYSRFKMTRHKIVISTRQC